MLLTDVNSPHSLKWLCALRDMGVNISCFSLNAPIPDNRAALTGIEVEHHESNASALGKLSYFGALPHMRRFIARVKPDILHAHYASSYGLLGALCNFQPYCISVWGSDVYEFPRQGIIQKSLLQYALRRASKCFSTSAHMAREAAKYRKGPIEVIAFGVDTERFKPKVPKPVGVLNFATAKTLGPIYNIPIAVQAIAQLLDHNPDLPISLHVAGDGEQMSQCQSLAGAHLNRKIHFHGRVAHSNMPGFFADKHVLINTPDTESFGVSVLEAAAAGMASIATRAGGLPEVVDEGITGVLIAPPTVNEVSSAVVRFIRDPGLAAKMGKAAQLFAERHYEMKNCLDKQLSAYKLLMD